jgi:hypothetical protein
MPREPDEHPIRALIKAYAEVAKKANYRPGHYADGLGGCTLTEKEKGDPELLYKEARAYY